VEKSNRVQLVYGYTVCVIAVVTFLICASVLVNNVFDLANPIAAGSAFGSSLSSFEAYQATASRPASAAPGQPDTASAATMRRRFDALRADKISRVSFEAWKAIVTSGLLLLISVALFVWHWRWMKRLGAAEAAAA
jgi:hypothetical protein